jgi:hypothetical protein
MLETPDEQQNHMIRNTKPRRSPFMGITPGFLAKWLE